MQRADTTIPPSIPPHDVTAATGRIKAKPSRSMKEGGPLTFAQCRTARGYFRSTEWQSMKRQIAVTAGEQTFMAVRMSVCPFVTVVCGVTDV
jgi:hypothetical protein